MVPPLYHDTVCHSHPLPLPPSRLQVLAIVLGILVFGTVLTVRSQVGVVVVIIGIILYSRESYNAKMAAASSDDKAKLPIAMSPIEMTETKKPDAM